VSFLRPKRGRAGAEDSTPVLPLTASCQWLLQTNQGQSTLGKILGEMNISTVKKQVLQSIAGAFPCNAVLHKLGVVPSAACAPCCHPAETQSHVQCLCPGTVPLLKEAWILAHHSMAQWLWKGIADATKGWTIVTEQTVAGIQGLPPGEQIDAWQRAWDELDDLHLECKEVQGTASRCKHSSSAEKARCLGSKRENQGLLILVLTMPNDRGPSTRLTCTRWSLMDLYKSLLDLLVRLLPGWEVEIQTYTVGIRGSHNQDRWYAQLRRLEVTAARGERLMQGMVSQALTKLADLYREQYAALLYIPRIFQVYNGYISSHILDIYKIYSSHMLTT
jgi:hypothetical protein